MGGSVGSGTGAWTYAARMRYRYDGANQRTVKESFEASGINTASRVALFVYPGDFERRGLVRNTTTYDAVTTGVDATETQYMVAGARIVWDPATSATSPNFDRNRRITYALTDLLQTSSGVVDLVSGELLELSTYYPNGARENLWASDSNAPLEPMGFTGKEADEEIGLTYFGERWLMPRLGRWASPDPLHVHASGGGEALNSYHYVSGNLLQARDPNGFGDEDDGDWHTWLTSAARLGERIRGSLISGGRTYLRFDANDPGRIFAQRLILHRLVGLGRAYDGGEQQEQWSTFLANRPGIRTAVDARQAQLAAQIVRHTVGTGALTSTAALPTGQSTWFGTTLGALASMRFTLNRVSLEMGGDIAVSVADGFATVTFTHLRYVLHDRADLNAGASTCAGSVAECRRGEGEMVSDESFAAAGTDYDIDIPFEMENSVSWRVDLRTGTTRLDPAGSPSAESYSEHWDEQLIVEVVRQALPALEAMDVPALESSAQQVGQEVRDGAGP